jgi:hypothetical protein
MNMHFAPTEKRLRQREPMCGYVGIDDEICTDPGLCTCPECLDWITPPPSHSAGVDPK